MSPVREFIVNFDKPDRAETVSETPGHTPLPGPDLSQGLGEEHAEDSAVRNVCFEWVDGRKAFFNYSYLVAVDLTIQDEINVLTLTFGSYKVVAKGYRLADLFERLRDHRPKVITTTHPRYALEGQHSTSVVFEISVKNE